MPRPSDGLQERVSVIADATVFDAVPMVVRMKDDVAGPEVIGDRIAEASQIDRPHTGDHSIGGLVRVTGEYEVRVGARKVATKILLVTVGRDPVAIVLAGRRVHAERGGPVRQHGSHLEGQRAKPVKPAVSSECTAGPSEGTLDRPVQREQLRVRDDVIWMRRWAVVSQDIAFGVPTDDLDAREVRDQLDRANRVRANGHEIAEHPPAADALLDRVSDHGLQCVPIAVDI